MADYISPIILKIAGTFFNVMLNKKGDSIAKEGIEVNKEIKRQVEEGNEQMASIAEASASIFGEMKGINMNTTNIDLHMADGNKIAREQFLLNLLKEAPKLEVLGVSLGQDHSGGILNHPTLIMIEEDIALRNQDEDVVELTIRNVGKTDIAEIECMRAVLIEGTLNSLFLGEEVSGRIFEGGKKEGDGFYRLYLPCNGKEKTIKVLIEQGNYNLAVELDESLSRGHVTLVLILKIKTSIGQMYTAWLECFLSQDNEDEIKVEDYAFTNISAYFGEEDEPQSESQQQVEADQ